MAAASGERPETATASGASHYDILARLAIGGMAEIFIARATTGAGVQRHVVLKRILPELARDPQFVGMFLREAQLAAQLHHPNIAQVHDVGRVGTSYFFTMEYVHGETVRALLQRVAAHRRTIPLPHVLTIIAGAAAGLHHAHERCGPDRQPLGVVHRDVTPSNLMVSFEGTVKLVDFGVAKAVLGKKETKTGGIKGKISYLSPEQCRGKPVDRRSDLFSLGIVFYEMLTATRLFRRETEFDTMSAIVHEAAPPPSERRPDLPADIDAIVLRLLAKRPADRFASAGELLETIEATAARHGLPLSPTALGRYQRELFGDRPEPWLELESADPEVRHVTVTTDVFEPIADLAITPDPDDTDERPSEHAAPEATAAAPGKRADEAADNPFAPDPQPVYDTTPIPASLSLARPIQPAGATAPRGKRARQHSTGPRAKVIPIDAGRRAPARPAPHVIWLVAAIGLGVAGGAFLVAHARGRGGPDGFATALEQEADKLAIAIDGTARSAQLRANGLATTPMLRAAIETDAATLEDMSHGDLLITVKGDEVLEIFQTKDGATTSMLRRPKAASALAAPTGAQPVLDSDGHRLRLVVGAPVKSTRPRITGTIAIAVPVDLDPLKQALARRAIHARLVGVGSAIPLVGGAGAPAGAPVTVPITATTLGPTKLALEARGAPVAVDNKLEVAGFAGLGAGFLLFAWYLAGALLARAQRR